MKLRMLVPVGGPWYAGAAHKYQDTRRGDIVEASEEEAERLVRFGYATDDLKSDVRDLPRGFNTPVWQR